MDLDEINYFVSKYEFGVNPVQSILFVRFHYFRQDICGNEEEKKAVELLMFDSMVEFHNLIQSPTSLDVQGKSIYYIPDFEKIHDSGDMLVFISRKTCNSFLKHLFLRKIIKEVEQNKNFKNRVLQDITIDYTLVKPDNFPLQEH